MEFQRRSVGRVVDLELLEDMDPKLYIHRFVELVRHKRGTKGRYLYLRTGDEVAIEAAGDGSMELLDKITVIDRLPENDSPD